jgi:hypothetical protein
MSKITESIKVECFEEELAKMDEAAAKAWPDAIMSRSAKVLSLALIGAREILEGKKT